MNIQKDIEFDLKKVAPLVSSELFKFVTEEIKNIVGKICTDNNLEISNVLDKYNMDIVNIGAKFGVKKEIVEFYQKISSVWEENLMELNVHEVEKMEQNIVKVI